MNIMKNDLKRKFGSLINKGWDKTQEAKAYEVFKNHKFGAKAIFEVLNSLSRIDTLEISYVIINKDKITNKSFRSAPYGTAYNYFTGVLLSELIFEDRFYDVQLIYDIKNKVMFPFRHVSSRHIEICDILKMVG